jgi:hypothetical protein
LWGGKLRVQEGLLLLAKKLKVIFDEFAMQIPWIAGLPKDKKTGLPWLSEIGNPVLYLQCMSRDKIGRSVG